MLFRELRHEINQSFVYDIRVEGLPNGKERLDIVLWSIQRQERRQYGYYAQMGLHELMISFRFYDLYVYE